MEPGAGSHACSTRRQPRPAPTRRQDRCARAGSLSRGTTGREAGQQPPELGEPGDGGPAEGGQGRQPVAGGGQHSAALGKASRRLGRLRVRLHQRRRISHRGPDLMSPLRSVMAERHRLGTVTVRGFGATTEAPGHSHLPRPKVWGTHSGHHCWGWGWTPVTSG